MAFDHVDDFQGVADVAKENNVRLVRMAAQIRAQFRPRTPHEDWSSGKFGAFLTKLVDEASCSLAASALLSYISVDLTKVVARRRGETNARHRSTPLSLRFRVHLLDMGGDFLVGVTATTLDRPINRLPQCCELGALLRR